MPLDPQSQKKVDAMARVVSDLLEQHTGERSPAVERVFEQIERHVQGLASAMKQLPQNLERKVSKAVLDHFAAASKEGSPPKKTNGKTKGTGDK